MIDEIVAVIEPKPLLNFVETTYVKDLVNRSLAYIQAGFPIHFRGASGTGKTTLALHIASKIGRPIILIHGDEQFTTANLVGGEYGYRSRKVVDRFVSRVLKVEEDMIKRWVDNRLTVACKHGLTLIYDEYTRSRPEANNVLLSILQEKILDLPAERNQEEPFLKVDPNFTAIFTSNPKEYAGVHESQDALKDRMINIDLTHPDYQTEVEITAAKSNLSTSDAAKIVKIVRGLRELKKCEFTPTVRRSIMIAKTLKTMDITPAKASGFFSQVCWDVLSSEIEKTGLTKDVIKSTIKTLVEKNC